MVVLAMADDAAPGVRRDDQRRHARAEPEAVDERRADVVEPAAALVVGDDDRDARPVAARHHLSDDLADPAIAGADRRGHRVGVLLPVRLHERDRRQAAIAQRAAELGRVADVRAPFRRVHDPLHVLERVVVRRQPLLHRVGAAAPARRVPRPRHARRVETVGDRRRCAQGSRKLRGVACPSTERASARLASSSKVALISAATSDASPEVPRSFSHC